MRRKSSARVEAALQAYRRHAAEGVRGIRARLGSDHAFVLKEIFVNTNLDRWNFDGEDLRGADFSGASLRGASFRGARIEGARFDCAMIERWRLREADDWRAHRAAWTPPEAPAATPHRAGELFSEAPSAPELVAPPWDPEDERVASDLDPEEAAALREGRLAVSAMLMTRAEASGAAPAETADELLPSEFKSVDLALEAVARLNARTGRLHRLPSAGLFRLLAAEAAGRPAESRDWRRRPPGPVDPRERPGEGRRTKHGFWDAAGVCRTLVRRAGAAGRLALAGGGWRDAGSLAAGDIAVEPGVDLDDVGLRLVRILPKGPWAAP